MPRSRRERGPSQWRELLLCVWSACADRAPSATRWSTVALLTNVDVRLEGRVVAHAPQPPVVAILAAIDLDVLRHEDVVEPVAAAPLAPRPRDLAVAGRLEPAERVVQRLPG